MSPFSVAVTNEDLLIVVSGVTCTGGTSQIAFSTNSGSSYTNFINILGSAAINLYGNMRITGIRLGSVRIDSSGSSTADTTNPAALITLSATTETIATFNPGATITNIEMQCTTSWAAGGTIKTYGRN
jgi:hypothetical protein